MDLDAYKNTVLVNNPLGESMSDIDRMREEIKAAYSSEKWWARVKKMSDAQVLAIHRKFKDEKKI